MSTKDPDSSSPKILDDGTNLYLNAPALARFFYELPEEEVAGIKPERAAGIRSYQQRVRARIEAQRCAGQAVDIQTAIAATLDMEALNEAIKRTDFNAIAEVLRGPEGARS
jgi:hypothetical protein